MKEIVPVYEPFDAYEIMLAKHESFYQVLEGFMLNPPATCDLCGVSFENRRFLLDACLDEERNPWGCVCAECFFRYNLEIGWGKGQLYTHMKNGEWILTAGNRT